MSIASNLTSGPYVANGSQTAFAFTFTVAAASEIRAQINGADVSSTLYTVALNADGTGTLTFSSAPANGATVLLISDPSFAQETIFEREGDYSLDAINAINRRDGVRANWLARALARILPAGWESGANFAGKFVAFDGSGNPVLSTGTGADAGLRADLAATTGAGLSGFSHALSYGAGSVGRKLQQTVSPKDAPYSAVGDGTTNDATALQNILNNEDHIHASLADTYAHSSALFLTRDNVAIDGLKLKPTTTRNMTGLTIGATAPDATTTLSANAAEFAVSVTVTSATGFAVGKLVLFTFSNPTWVAADSLAASYQFVTRIIGVSGSTITLQDALPHAIQSAWTHSVQAWTPTRNPRLRIEVDQSAHGATKTITAITQANPAVFTTSTAHGFTTGDTVDINGPLTGMTQMRSAQGIVTVISPTTFSLPIDSTAFSAYTGGATVRQTGTGVLIGCVDGGEIEIIGYDNDGAGALVQVNIAYNPRIRLSARNCGNGNRGDIHTFAFTGGTLEVRSDDASGFGPTLLGGHYATVTLSSGLRSDLGRGFKVGKTKLASYYIGPVNNPAFTAIGVAWVSQDISIHCGAAAASVRSVVQPVGFWTSGCYNTGVKVIGLIAKGSTNYDAQVNNTDSVEFIGCTIGKLDVPTGGTATLTGGTPPTAVTGAGTLTRIQNNQITVRATANFPAEFYSDNFYYVRATANAATSGQSGFAARAKDGGGTERGATFFNVGGNAGYNVETSFYHQFQVNSAEIARIYAATAAQGAGLTLALGPASTSYANDAAAAAGGVPVGGVYRNGSVLQVRVS